MTASSLGVYVNRGQNIKWKHETFGLPLMLLRSLNQVSVFVRRAGKAKITHFLLNTNLKIRIYKTIILPVVLYGCETWSVTLREEHRLGVFENRVLRRIFEPKRDEVTGEWRKLHNEELHDLYSLPSFIRIIKARRMKWVGHVARMGEKRNAYRLLVGKPEGRRPLGKSRLGGWIIFRWIF
jgi:hypothetical protein